MGQVVISGHVGQSLWHCEGDKVVISGLLLFLAMLASDYGSVEGIG